MGYRNLSDCLEDLARTNQLVRLESEVDPHLDAAAIHLRMYRAGGPAVLFTRPKGCRFPLVSNLYGTKARMEFIFRDSLEDIRKLVALKADPGRAMRKPWRYWNLPALAWRMRPAFRRHGPILQHTCSISDLPAVQCWPRDGGPFVTLPQVYTEHPQHPGWLRSNLGMYRVQLSGNQFERDREVGLHYQIHRGIGVHHAAAVARGEKLRVNIVVGGPPSLAVSAVMPLPETLPELAFAGVLGGRRLRLVPAANGLPMPAEADFVLSGTIDPARTKPEGPFGDHLGYYSLVHDFPVMTVEKVYHRPGAIWPFTVVGRPPQEDTHFGELIHTLTGPAIPAVLPGVKAVHAVDTSGVHPLLLAVGSERYVPYAQKRKPQELLTLANAILGNGQLSLAKYLLIAAQEDAPDLDPHHIPEFFQHVLERVDWRTDLHFQTCTTMDTLDYSAGQGLNVGSKLVIAVAGEKRRELPVVIPPGLNLPEGCKNPHVVAPGILAVEAETALRKPGDGKISGDTSNPFPLVVIVDDAEFTAKRFENFLWVVFTRSNPASDVWGVDAATHDKHWGCPGPLVIDARMKPHMAPALEEDPAVAKRVNELFTSGGPLYAWRHGCD
jgi:4-hydroxy-3-polyprenylbenzoate decarboxylase